MFGGFVLDLNFGTVHRRKEEIMRKLQSAVFLVGLLFSSSILPAAVAAVPSNSGKFNASVSRAGCRVSTRGGNLNVRNNAGNVIAKLNNGISVRVVTDDGDRLLISAYVGRRTIRGWVASEFITCN